MAQFVCGLLVGAGGLFITLTLVGFAASRFKCRYCGLWDRGCVQCVRLEVGREPVFVGAVCGIDFAGRPELDEASPR